MMDTLADILNARIKELEAENARLRRELDARDERIAQLEAKLDDSLGRIAQLERQLGLNSRNSSKPPSSDGPKERAARQKKKKKKRLAGGQKGHAGHHRNLWPIEKVDHIEQYFPAHCADCGLELSRKDAVGEPWRHQVFEIPPRLIECTEHQAMACVCPGCGHKTRAALPEGASKIGWGPDSIRNDFVCQKP